MVILDFLQSFLSNASILVGLMALIGLLALKRPFEEIVTGTIKSILGFLILGAGAGVVIGAISPLGDLFTNVLKIPNSALPVNEVFTSIVQQSLGREIALTFLFAFLLNLLFARITPYKYIWLTGHHTLFVATLTAGMFSVMPIFAGKTWLIIAVSSVISAIMMTFMPALSMPFMKKITGGDGFAMGHFGITTYGMAGYLGQFVGDPEDSTENMNFPDWIGFMKEPLVAMASVMLIIYIIVGLLSGGFAKEALGQYWVVGAFIQSLTFSGGIAIILLGVRTVLAEIVPAFRGIAEKIVPDAKPALDCPVVFPYAPNAVLVGYLTSIVGGLVAMVLQLVTGGALGGVILPSMIIHFFVGGTAGVFGNSTGGRKGAILGGLLNGFAFTLLAGLTYTSFGGLNPDWAGSSFGDTDFGVVGNILSFLGNLLK
ncbi:MAG: PTS ascorbate transporter subunit IIC [Brevefilum sp.]|jgi:PTS system ascorbate-specific IIC component